MTLLDLLLAHKELLYLCHDTHTQMTLKIINFNCHTHLICYHYSQHP